MTPATLATYGGPYEDMVPVEDPTKEMGADFGNLSLEHVAQMTNTTIKWRVKFLTITSVATVAAANVTVQSHYGSGSVAAAKPTVARTATGAYTLTFASTYNNGLPTPVAESITFFDAKGHVLSTTEKAHVQCSYSGTVVSVVLLDDTFSAVDLTLGTTVIIELS